MAIVSGLPAGAARVVEHNALGVKRMGRGRRGEKGAGGVGGVHYIDFRAPGLLAATTMQTAAFECTYPILGKILWDRIYDAMLATPLGVRDAVVAVARWVT